MNLTALNIRKYHQVLHCWILQLTRLPDMNLVWQANQLACFQNIDEILLTSSLEDGLSIIYERGGHNYIYPFFQSDLLGKTLGDLRLERLKELEGGNPVNPLVAQLHYYLKE